MMKPWAGAPEQVKVHPNGTLFEEVENARGQKIWQVWRCFWLLRVPSGHPEPDSEADLWTEVECGGKLKDHPDFPGQGFVCEHGHDRVPLEVAWEREAEREALERAGERF